MKQILIIKLGALGDVIRTTPLLRVLEGEITWVTSLDASPFLRDNPRIANLLCMDEPGFSLDRKYDLVINLEDDASSAQLASAAAAGYVVGPYLNGSCITYDPPASEWFDMSLSSLYGKQKADELKMRNRKTYQQMIFSSLGFTFRGEEPIMNLPLGKKTSAGSIGIERRAGGIWPSKRWTRYTDLAERLEALGYRTWFFKQRDSVIEYADDINQCEFVICGDTLAMHIALALGKRVVALFTCTSPHEIYGYGRLEKVVSPLLNDYFYRREYSPEPANAIAIADVEERFRAIAEIGEASRLAPAESDRCIR